MILIVDSGSTKSDWTAIDEKGNQVFKPEKTAGLNPSVFSKEQLKNTIKENSVLMSVKNEVSHIFFYGAGCGTENFKQLLAIVLESIFEKAIVSVYEDTMAAVYATIQSPNEKALVCILGTGSNCSYYDGKQLYQKVVSLGYSIMDDASGNYFGRLLLRDYYFNSMPQELKEDFNNTFNTSAESIKEHLYKKAHPNAYLAHFASFMVTHKENEYILSLVKNGIRLFTQTMLFQYKEELKTVSVNFVGSIAHFFRKEIEEVAKENDFILGKIIRKPIDNLTTYHIKYLI